MPWPKTLELLYDKLAGCAESLIQEVTNVAKGMWICATKKQEDWTKEDADHINKYTLVYIKSVDIDFQSQESVEEAMQLSETQDNLNSIVDDFKELQKLGKQLADHGIKDNFENLLNQAFYKAISESNEDIADSRATLDKFQKALDKHNQKVKKHLKFKAKPHKTQEQNEDKQAELLSDCESTLEHVETLLQNISKNHKRILQRFNQVKELLEQKRESLVIMQNDLNAMKEKQQFETSWWQKIVYIVSGAIIKIKQWCGEKYTQLLKSTEKGLSKIFGASIASYATNVVDTVLQTTLATHVVMGGSSNPILGFATTFVTMYGSAQYELIENAEAKAVARAEMIEKLSLQLDVSKKVCDQLIQVVDGVITDLKAQQEKLASIHSEIKLILESKDFKKLDSDQILKTMTSILDTTQDIIEKVPQKVENAVKEIDVKELATTTKQ